MVSLSARGAGGRGRRWDWGLGWGALASECYYPRDLKWGKSDTNAKMTCRHCLTHSPVPIIVVRPERKVKKVLEKRRADPKRGKHFDGCALPTPFLPHLMLKCYRAPSAHHRPVDTTQNWPSISSFTCINGIVHRLLNHLSPAPSLSDELPPLPLPRAA
jgi:hypothetical protein